MTKKDELHLLKRSMVHRARITATFLAGAIVITMVCMIYGFIQSAKASLAVEQCTKSAEEIQMLRMRLAECSSVENN